MPGRFSTNGRGLGRKVEGHPRVKASLAVIASGQERLPGGFKGPMQRCEERECALCKNFLLSLWRCL
jgi:hypothetical protein